MILLTVSQNSNMITELQDHLEEPYTEIYDLENHVGCYNFHIRVLPETVKDDAFSYAICCARH